MTWPASALNPLPCPTNPWWGFPCASSGRRHQRRCGRLRKLPFGINGTFNPAPMPITLEIVGLFYFFPGHQFSENCHQLRNPNPDRMLRWSNRAADAVSARSLCIAWRRLPPTIPPVNPCRCATLAIGRMLVVPLCFDGRHRHHAHDGLHPVLSGTLDPARPRRAKGRRRLPERRPGLSALRPRPPAGDGPYGRA